ncbi:MAG: PP2C family protein-serine/threonine phosphatase, partial [Bryobacteraceae bacterium]
WGMSDTGRVRQNNEDTWLYLPEMSVAVVADGMGGAACGEVASAMTVETVITYLREPPEQLPDDQMAKEAIRHANGRVWEMARNRTDCNGMGSTIVMARWKPPEMIIANVGDSRAYLWRQGALTQLSYDQNLANELRQSLGLSEEQISQYPHRHVLTMAIGTAEDVLVCVHTFALEEGDDILLCSDGLYGPLGDEGIAGVLCGPAGAEEKIRRLIADANARGGPDNLTAILLEFRG